ncbi:MAG: CDP-alcohol phosphatidyltransferase family protein [Chloroflexota bacterium]
MFVFGILPTGIMCNREKKLLNPYILIRLGMVPILWWLVIVGYGSLAGWLLIPTLLTDWLDGRLARQDERYADPWLDGAADKILAISVVVWLFILQPQMIERYRPILILLLCGWVFLHGISLLKRGTLSDLHLLSGKIGGLLQGIFVLTTMISGRFIPILFCIAALSFGIAQLEESLI